MNAVIVESINHLFVFHREDHLCISMIGRPQVNKTFGRLQVIFNALPRSQTMMESVLEKSHKSGVSASSFSHNGAPGPPSQCPAFTVKVVGL